MKLSLRVSEKQLDFLDGITSINANDVMWQKLEVYLDKQLSTKESLWITYKHTKFGEHSHEILFAEDGTGKLATADIPEEVIRIAGSWSAQVFIRQYSITDPTKYTQGASNKIFFTVEDGLPLDGAGNPVNNATIGALYEEAKMLLQSSGKLFELNVSSTDNAWEQVNGRWQVRVLQTQHNLKNVQDIIAERLSQGGTYENMIYGYKKYSSGSIAIIVDEKIDMKIIIKGV